MAEEKNIINNVFAKDTEIEDKPFITLDQSSDLKEEISTILKYISQTYTFQATTELLSIWHILKRHINLPKTNRGVFRSICINTPHNIHTAVSDLMERKTVKYTNLVFGNNNSILPEDYDHNIRKIHNDICIQLLNNKVYFVIAEAKNLTDVYALTSVIYNIRDFGQTNTLILPNSNIITHHAICFLHLLYRDIYAVLFPWTDRIFLCFANKILTKTKLIDVCESARKHNLLYCTKEILEAGKETVAKIYEDASKIKFEEQYFKQQYEEEF